MSIKVEQITECATKEDFLLLSKWGVCRLGAAVNARPEWIMIPQSCVEGETLEKSVDLIRITDTVINLSFESATDTTNLILIGVARVNVYVPNCDSL